MVDDLAHTIAKPYVEPAVVEGLTREEAMHKSRYVLYIPEMVSDLHSIHQAAQGYNPFPKQGGTTPISKLDTLGHIIWHI